MLHVGGLDFVQRYGHKLLPRSSLLRGTCLDLRFDVELHLTGPVRVDKSKHFRECGHGLPGRGLLPGELGKGAASAVQRADLVEGQVLDVLADIGELQVSGRDRGGVGAFRSADLAVVRDYFASVLGDLQIEFKGGHSRFESFGESGKGGLNR